jgi:hypothetical protein
MSDDTLIEDLVRAGVSPDLVGRVARMIVVHGIHRNSAEQADARRARDRERKKKKPNVNKDMAKANDVAIVNIVPRKSAEGPGNGSAEHCDTYLLKLTSTEESKKDQQVRTEYVDGRKRKTGTRIPPDWRLSESLIVWCRSVGVVGSQLETLVAEFIDYWIAVPGQRGTKLDWDATFRNRVRQKVPTKPLPLPTTPLKHGTKLQDGVYVMADTPEWEAWCRYLRQQGKTTPPIAKSGGWRFETLWPPSYEHGARVNA